MPSARVAQAGKKAQRIDRGISAENLLRALGELILPLEPGTVLSRLPAVVQRNFGYSNVSVFALKRGADKLALVSHSGKGRQPSPQQFKLEESSGLVGWSAVHAETLVVNDLKSRTGPSGFSTASTKSALTIPLTSTDGVVAVLSIEEPNTNAFGEAQSSVLRLFCEQVSKILENAQRYQQLKRSADRLDELDKMKTEYVGIVSHDFRSPLSSILLAAKGLLKNEQLVKTKQVKEHLSIIVDQAVRLSHLAEDTLSLTELESGKLNYSFKILNVERLVQDAIAMVKPSSRHKISYSIHPDVAYVKGDQNKLRQVVTNLLSNAAKYSPQGGRISVEVKEQSRHEVVFSISDDGVGIPDSEKEKLFRKFSRLEHKDLKEVRGAGLGLWISKEIVTAHGGRIWCESKVGHGSTFHFTLRKTAG